MPAEDIDGHVRLSRSTVSADRIGESLYHPSHFREYLQRGGCSIVQVDVARIGGITPWLKTAHLAETFNMQVCPHYLMEIHVALCAAVPNSTWVEFIPQLDVITNRGSKLLTAMLSLRQTLALVFHGIGRRSNVRESDTPFSRRRNSHTEASAGRCAKLLSIGLFDRTFAGCQIKAPARGVEVLAGLSLSSCTGPGAGP